MKKRLYRNLYTLLTYVTNRFANKHLIRYKIIIGSLLICMYGNGQNTKQEDLSQKRKKQSGHETDSVLVEGKIEDQFNEPLIGAAISAANQSHHTSTDMDGKFRLMVPTGTKEITISYIGYKTMTVPIGPIIKVRMEEDTSAMVDCYVMVLPYGTQKKSSLPDYPEKEVKPYAPQKELNQSPDSMTIEGIILDAETRQPVVGVSVQAKKLPIGAVTDSNGRFTLQIPKKVKKIKVSYIGYFTQELTPRPLMQIILKEDNTPMCYEAPVRRY